jgi:alpha-mannosidase
MGTVKTRCALIVAALVPLAAAAQEPAAPGPIDRRLYVVATAHLDTQWRWTIQDTISQYIPDTLRDNFALLERYPGYVFSFEGAFRYQLMKEYYPEEYERMKRYVSAGRWKVAGSWVDAVDTHVPSPESLIRHALYGNGFFRRELGRTSRDVFLPDCFGFGYALPSVAAHSGLFAFSTQKLTWGSFIKMPFDIGLWEGIDGSALIASINPGNYVSEITRDPALDSAVYATQDLQAQRSGLPVALRYFGTGDVGGAPTERSVRMLQESLERKEATRVIPAAPDQLARDLLASASPKQIGRLPRYRGEFLMTAHGTGCYTSQAAMKRYNRANEVLADAAERAAVAADWLGALPYPRETLREAWTRFLWHQFHDDLTGTSIPEAYTFSWNDETIAGNQLADVLATAAAGVSGALDTRGEGVPLVVYNPLAIAREDVVEAWVTFAGAPSAAVAVVAPDGRSVPAQVAQTDGDALRVVFLAGVAPVSFSVFSVRPAAQPSPPGGELSASPAGLENARYRITIDSHGDVASLYDKRLSRELLRAPLRLQLLDDEPEQWSAWEIDYADISAPPKAVLAGPARVTVVESGPARVAVEVAREALGSTFVQRIRLAAGAAGNRVEVEHEVDWRSPGTLLKAAFPLAAASELATYDLGLGAVQRGTSRPNLYEVPAQRWADLSAPDGSFGVAVMNDSRYGWDHPDAGTLRLTLVHTPRIVRSWSWLDDQASMDLGHHRVLIGLAGHAGDWRDGGVLFQADRLNQPLIAWQAVPHPGGLGRSFSLLAVDSAAGGVPPVAVRAIKRAEASGEVVIRLQELSGRPLDGVRVRLAVPVIAVRELNGAEEPLTEHGTGGALPAPLPPLALQDGAIVVGLAPFRPRTLALTISPAAVTVAAQASHALALPYDRDGISDDAAPRDGNFDGAGRTVAGDVLPETFVSGGVTFRTGPRGAGAANVVACRGQRLVLPDGALDAVYLAAAAVGGDRPATFVIDGSPVTLTVHDWAEPVGQWNSRVVAGELEHDPATIAPAYEKVQPLAWVGTHRHSALGENEPYVFTHVYRYRLGLPPGARTVTLPDDPGVIVLAATAVTGEHTLATRRPPATRERRSVVHLDAAHRVFTTTVPVTLTSPNPGAVIRYTLDGSEPTEASLRYDGPVVLTDSAALKTRAFASGLDSSFVAGAMFTRTVLRAPDVPVTPAGAHASGLECGLYEGPWRTLPDFSALTPVRTLTMPTVGLPADRPAERFGMVCRGLLTIPADGVYTLGLRSDDGSRLFVGGTRVIDNDGTHDKQERRAELALAAGAHAIRVEYFQWSHGATLELWLGGDRRPYSQVTGDMLRVPGTALVY